MASAPLFPSVLVAEFTTLDPYLRWVHAGESRKLQGRVTVQRGTSFVAKALAALASLPPAMSDASIDVHIETSGGAEQWTRVFANRNRMVSTLHASNHILAERLGPVALHFRLLVRDAGIDWVLEHIFAGGIPLPRSWFLIFARIDVRDGHYHFLVDSALRGVGRVVRYEGLLDAAP
jgi:Domain of unknown function (DUF4166)